ncbi:hypothetical protein [Bacillus niameyensis]|uniref:hypothetical protein n=1 Tax=Bacillus niameyensis TaxID=1522308 RepID=UPI0007842E62|nr:hypothetical protein [Bacillus niameyensis]
MRRTVFIILCITFLFSCSKSKDDLIKDMTSKKEDLYNIYIFYGNLKPEDQEKLLTDILEITNSDKGLKNLPIENIQMISLEDENKQDYRKKLNLTEQTILILDSERIILTAKDPQEVQNYVDNIDLIDIL